MIYFLRLIFSLAVGMFIPHLFNLFVSYDNKFLGIVREYEIIIIIAIILVVYFFISRIIFKKISEYAKKVLKKDPNEIIVVILGMVISLVIARLVSGIFTMFLHGYGYYFAVIVFALITYAGFLIACGLKDKIDLFDGKSLSSLSRTARNSARPKVIDTSVIIDGRILDVLKTGFIEGSIIIPSFILEELRHIADSSDNLKRGRGRLGLDVLNKIQELENIPIEIIDYESDQDIEVDVKLLKVAEQLDAYVVTNDYNLNKVAGIHKVPVLNINDLSNAVKSIILPGQDLNLFILKEGKEAEQGIGYLNDGTMIVVEDSKKYIGRSIAITVTSALQTSAGRMIFAKPKEDNED